MTRPDPAPSLSRFVSMGRVLVRYRLPIQMAFDLVAWAIGLYLAMALRFDSFAPAGWNHFHFRRLLIAMAAAAAFQAVAGLALGLYLGRWRFGTIDEVSHLVGSVAITTAALAVVNQLSTPLLVPASVTVAGGIIALILMGGARYAWRLALERNLRPSGDGTRRALVFGAGEGGVQTITAMLRSPTSPYLPVAMLDDDPAKRNLRVRGVRVVGGRNDLARAAADYDASAIVMAMPGASSDLLRDLCDLASEASLEILVLPPITELFGGPIGVGRHPAPERGRPARPPRDRHRRRRHRRLPDRPPGARHRGRRIDRQRAVPPDLALRPRRRSSCSTATSRPCTPCSCSSRAGRCSTPGSWSSPTSATRPRLLDVFAEHRPQVVFHAAALKHLPLLEMHPSEAVKTNIAGTQNVLEAAGAVGVERFVNISTDKAADPISVLGYTKRICERLTAAATSASVGTYLSVRFGNVLGSRGSVLTAFHAQIEAGGPLTVTDPDVTRYFMTVEEAVQLVIQAGAVGQRRRGPRARHGRARPHRRRGPPTGRAGPAHDRDRLHGPATRREAPRGPARPGRDRRPPGPPADLAGPGAAAAPTRWSSTRSPPDSTTRR